MSLTWQRITTAAALTGCGTLATLLATVIAAALIHATVVVLTHDHGVNSQQSEVAPCPSPP